MHVHSLYTLCFVILENHALWLVGQGGTLLGSLEVSSMGLGCLPMVGYYGGGPRDRKFFDRAHSRRHRFPFHISDRE
ncbi:putative dehydrogenase [Klebsiella pneumoniae]|nr:putative dehydrogenase [Klebsiella pneumoniae]